MHKLFLFPALIFVFLFVGCTQPALAPTEPATPTATPQDYLYLDGYSYEDANNIGVFRLQPGGDLQRQFGADAHMPSFFGDKVVFVRGGTDDTRRQLGDLYLANADGSQPVNLTNTPHYNETAPSFSPDGTQIGYLQDRSFCLINVDGTQPWCFNHSDLSYQIISDQEEYHQPLEYTRAYAYSWGPDGQVVISATYTPPNQSTLDVLYLVRLVDNRIDSVTFLGPGTSAQFAPDSQSVSYFNERQILLLNLTSGQTSVLIQRPMTTQVVYSPDGSQIAYLEDDYLKVADAQGQNARRYSGPFTNWHPVDITWSPDGQRLGYIDFRFEINPDDQFYHLVGDLTLVDLSSGNLDLVHTFTYPDQRSGIYLTAWVTLP